MLYSENSLYRLLLRQIEKGKTEGLARKIDLFFLNGSLTEEEYLDLTQRLKEKEKTA